MHVIDQMPQNRVKMTTNWFSNLLVLKRRQLMGFGWIHQHEEQKKEDACKCHAKVGSWRVSIESRISMDQHHRWGVGFSDSDVFNSYCENFPFSLCLFKIRREITSYE